MSGFSAPDVSAVLPGPWFDDQPGLDAFRRARAFLAEGRALEALAVLDGLDGFGREALPAPGWELRVRALLALGREAEGRAACRKALELFPHDAELAALLGQIVLELGEAGEALGLFEAACRTAQPPDAALLNALALRPREIEAAPDAVPGAVAATSIPPFHHEQHRLCVGSWLAQGLRVVSLNPPEELAELRAEHPGVEFYPARRDARAEAGRPCVHVDDLLELLAGQPEPVCAVINADVFLRPLDGLGAWLAARGAEGFVFGSRADVDALDASEGRMYHVGFDLFFFPRAMLPRLSAHGIALGTPWWDYALPLAALHSPEGAARIASPVALHVRHAQNWSLTQGWRNGLRLFRALYPDAAQALLAGADTSRHDETLARLLAGVAGAMARTLHAAPRRLLFPGAGFAPLDKGAGRHPLPGLRVAFGEELPAALARTRKNL
jgi:hypothetical protein